MGFQPTICPTGQNQPFTNSPINALRRCGGLETHPTTKPCGFVVGWKAHPITDAFFVSD
ncbi:MAG: hypothetical protein IKI11_08440 [Neisseriaceae bacterium]|nr:hypothetical protein [Neisseriaceae bacterium]